MLEAMEHTECSRGKREQGDFKELDNVQIQLEGGAQGRGGLSLEKSAGPDSAGPSKSSSEL